MKLLLSALFICFSFIGMSQDGERCPQLPNAKPAIKAEYGGDLVAYFSADLSEDLKKGTITATFRMYVDCHGDVSKAKFQSGTMNETDQKSFLELIYAMKWTPAQDQKVDVTSNVYLEFEITNGVLKVTRY